MKWYVMLQSLIDHQRLRAQVLDPDLCQAVEPDSECDILISLEHSLIMIIQRGLQ